MKELTTKDINRITGLSIRVIQRLAEKGLIGKKMNIRNAPGKKCALYLFSKEDLKSEAVRESIKRIRK